jgi:hypothetical protein
VYEGGSIEWEFQFYKYGTYALHNWLGTGLLANHQTCGATFRTYGQAGQQLKPYPPRSTAYGVDWGPVYRISLNGGSC